MVFPPLVPVKRRRVIYVAAGPAPSMTRAGSSRCAPARDGLGSAPRTPGLLQAGDNKGWKTVNWLYWGLAAFLAAGSLALVLAPLWRRPAAPARRAAYDMQVLKDQLREIEADHARGLMSDGEAKATRAEVARRLLAASEAEGAEAVPGAAPARLSHAAAALLGVAGLGATAFLYVTLGSPGLPDAPRAERLAAISSAHAARPGQAEAESAAAAQNAPRAPSADDGLIEKLKTVLAERPTDLEGHRLLARSLAAMNRWAEARAAQADVITLLGPQASAQDYVDLAELGVMAAGGYVSPETEAALTKALQRDPANPGARYYSALTALQGGRPDLAYRLFGDLVAAGPADAPWIAGARAGLEEAARQANLPPPAPAAGAPGPGVADVEAAEAMSPEDRQAMIEGMVANLQTRLDTQGGAPAEWARLIGAYRVLGREDEARVALAKARAAFAADPGAIDQINAAAEGLAP